jgi:hypothetical protein
VSEATWRGSAKRVQTASRNLLELGALVGFMRVWRCGLGQALLVLTVAAACESAPSTVATTSETPTAQALQSRQLIVLAELGSQTSVRLVTPSGHVVADYPYTLGRPPLAVAGNRIFVATQGGELMAIDRDGSVEDLGPLGTCCPSLVPSPDGKRWLWQTVGPQSNGIYEFPSQIHEAGDGLADRVVEQYTGARVLRPYAWTAAGVFIEHSLTGIGGYFPFKVIVAPMDRLELDTGKVTPLAAGDGCSLGDVAADGTIACFVMADQSSTLRVVAPNGGTKNLALARPQFTIAGEAWFDPSGTVLMAAGATGVGNGFVHPQPQPEEYTTYLVRLDGSMVQFGPAGARPALGVQSWLSSQQLVLWRPLGAAGGQPGLYVLDMSGRGNFIADPGVPVGVLS